MDNISNELGVRNTNHNNINSDEHVKIILLLLEIGILFEYLNTIGIINLLTSSHVLMNFIGI